MVDKAATNLLSWWRFLFNIITYCLLVIFDAFPSFKTALRKSCLRPYFPWFANFYSRTVHKYLGWLLKYGSIRPDIFPNNVSCLDMVWKEKKNCKHTFSFVFAFFIYLVFFQILFTCKTEIQNFFFCDHNVMSSFWVISFLIKNKSMALTFFKLQLHNWKKLTIHRLNLPNYTITIVKAS